MPTRKPKERSKATRKTPPQPPPHSFQFINLGEQGRITRDDDHSIIREVVMTNFHNQKKRQKISSSSGRTSAGSSSTNTLSSTHVGVFHINEGDEGELTKSKQKSLQELTSQKKKTRHNFHPPAEASTLLGTIPSIRNLLISKKKDKATFQRLTESFDLFPPSLDCLSSFPSNETARSQFLIDNFFHDRSRTSLLMMGVRKSWFRNSLQDPAFFSAMLSHFSACAALRNRGDDPLESLKLKMEANRIINERLGDWEGGISDGTIGAVASLANFEAVNGTVATSKTHMEGLSQMVKLRGGFQKARFPPAIQRQIAWAEICLSSVLSTPPMILPFSSPSLTLPAYGCTEAPRGTFATSPGCNGDYEVEFSTINIDPVAIFNDLRFLTGIREASTPTSIRESDSMWFSDRVYLVQRNLNYATLSEDVGDMSLLDKACCGAASLFTHIYLRDLEFHSRIMTVIVHKFKEALEAAVGSIVRSLYEMEEGDTTKLLWVLVVAGISALGKPEREWFAATLSEMRKFEPRWSRETARNTIQEILWTKEWDSYFDTLWKESLPQ